MNMSFYLRQFNLYLLVFCVTVACGCASLKKEKEKMSGIRVHLEVQDTPLAKAHAITVIRATPLTVNIGDDPIVTEQNLLSAKLVESMGGYAVAVKFDETGGWFLEQATSANPGKHLAIFGQWGETLGESRWLSAQIIGKRIPDGYLVFTPDASRAEMERFVEGLNNTAKKIHSGPVQ